MPLEELRRLVLQQPFVPFRLHVSDNVHYDVVHRDMIMLGARSVTVGIPAPDDPGLYNHVAVVALVHITRLEPLAPSQAPV